MNKLNEAQRQAHERANERVPLTVTIGDVQQDADYRLRVDLRRSSNGAFPGADAQV
jgi:hypothetical protein